MSFIGSRKAVIFGGSSDPLLKPWLATVGGASSSYTKAFNDFLKGLRSDGSLQTLDYLAPIAVERSAQLVDVIGLKAATLVNSPTLLPLIGAQGDGSSASISTGFNPATNGVNYVRDSAAYGAFVQTNGTVNGRSYMGSHSTTNNFNRGSATNTGWAVNGGGASTNIGGLGIGLQHVERTASNLSTIYLNGASQGTQAGASAAVTNAVMFALCSNNGSGTATAFSNGTLALLFAGGSMGATLAALFSIRAKNFLQAVGGTTAFP